MFAAVVFAFFLPFVTCEGATVNGVQAATGMTPPGSDPAVTARFAAEAMVPDPFALVAFLCAGAGIAFMVLRGRAGPFASALAGIIGVISLGGFAIHAFGQASGQLAVEYGLALAILGFLGTVALNHLLLARIPLRSAGDDAGLARRSAMTRRWVAGLGALFAPLLLITAAMNESTGGAEDATAFLVALIPVGVLALVALRLTIGSFRRARPAPADAS